MPSMESSRLAVVLQRTLRRQAQEFLDRPFTQRRCRLYEYAMSDDGRSLYDDVTEYLLQPSLYAFAGRQRRLLLIEFAHPGVGVANRYFRLSRSIALVFVTA